MKQVQTNQAPQAIGPYSQAIVTNDFIFCSGQIALTPDGEMVEDDIQAQTKQVITNLSAVLQAAGSSLEHVIKTTCYLTDITKFQEFNAIYHQYFGKTKPARATVEVSKLPKGAKVEIEVIAER